jgi:transposase
MHTETAIRAQVVALRAYTTKSSSEIARLTGLSTSSVNRIYARAIERGFNPHEDPIIHNRYVEDTPRSGRPTKQDTATQEIVISKVRSDRYGREKSCADLAGDLSKLGINISAETVRRILKKNGFRKTKPTRKPGLTPAMKKARLEWALERQHWTIEDCKNIIWSDETSVILLHRRGGYRIWRTPSEAYSRSCIRERWKGASEFMFWGCFTYDKKGPCHCWAPETAAEKREAEKAIEQLNAILEPELRQEWELTNRIRRLNLRQTPGRQPQWRFNQ